MARRRLVSNLSTSWDSPGQQVIGKYLSVEEVTMSGGKVINKYLIDTGDNTTTVMGTQQIDESMIHVSYGEVVEITYKGTIPTSAGFTLQLFEVAVLEEGDENGEE